MSKVFTCRHCVAIKHQCKTFHTSLFTTFFSATLVSAPIVFSVILKITQAMPITIATAMAACIDGIRILRKVTKGCADFVNAVALTLCVNNDVVFMIPNMQLL